MFCICELTSHSRRIKKQFGVWGAVFKILYSFCTCFSGGEQNMSEYFFTHLNMTDLVDKFYIQIALNN